MYPCRRNSGRVSTPPMPSAATATAPKRCRKDTASNAATGSPPSVRNRQWRTRRLRTS